MTSPVISCQIHDYVEIACLYGYPVRLTLDNGDRIEGQAITSFTRDKKEYLVIKTPDDQPEIGLNRINSMQALTVNPHFQRIDF